MNWLKNGPELKMPKLKVPNFLIDLYWDLRDRRLLPLVVLAILAVIAVPFLLGGSGDSSSAPTTPPTAAPSPEPAGSKLTVVEAKPGLRDYRKRLRDDKPSDPFERPGASSSSSDALACGCESEPIVPTAPSPTSTVTSTSTSTSTTVTKTSNSNGTKTEVTTEQTGGAAGGGPVESGHLILYAFAIDVKIVRTETKSDGSKQTDDPVVRHHVVSPASLPDEKDQAVTYMGISPKTRAPLLLISDAVTSVFGEAKCLSGESTCQLIEVETGMPMTFVYGPESIRYKITVLKVEPVVAGQG